MNFHVLFTTIICGLLLLSTGSPLAVGQTGPVVDALLPDNGDDSRILYSRTAADQSQGADGYDAACDSSCCCPRWTASADFIILDRIGSINQRLVERVSGSEPFGNVSSTPGVEALDSNDMRQGFAAGPRVGLTRHMDDGYDLELSYFQIDGWSSARTIGPDNPADWLVMRAPGGFLQAQDHPTQAMAWEYDTKLYNAELNVRWQPCCRVTMLAGFRWLNLREHLQGALVPSTWEPPFWNTTTTNNLFGFQIGGDGKILERDRFSIDGLVKTGIYDDNAEEATGVSIFKVVRPSSASANHTAFVGEVGIECKYQVAKRFVVKAGYEAMWLSGVALAPGQVQETSLTPPKTEHALGVNCDTGVFFHGATAGLEFSF